MLNPLNLRPSVPAVLPRTSTRSAGQAEQDGPERANAGPTRGHTKPGVLATALDMHDDLSALVATLQRRRQESADGSRPMLAWLEHVLEDSAPEKRASFRQALLALKGADRAGVEALLAQWFPDPSDAVLVLRSLLAEDELQALRETLQELLEQLEHKHGQAAVRAGINVGLKARRHARVLQVNAKQLRASYRSFLAAEDALDLYAMWVEEYGFDRREAVVDFIEQALAADMYALDPSCSRIEFGSLLHSARQLTTLRSVDAQLMRECWQGTALAKCGVTAQGLLSAVLALLAGQGGLAAMFTDGPLQAVRYGLSGPDKVQLAQRLRRFFKYLPHGMWSLDELQEQVMAEIDELVERSWGLEPMARSQTMRVRG